MIKHFCDRCEGEKNYLSLITIEGKGRWSKDAYFNICSECVERTIYFMKHQGDISPKGEEDE